MESTFGMLDFAGSLPSVVYVEGLVGWILQERPQDVERYQRVFEILCKIALNEEDSIALIANIARDLRGGGGSQ
jgi:hypothetical protein